MSGLNGKEIADHAALSEYTTFKLGGTCRALITCSTEEAFVKTMREIHKRHERHVVLGGGSNSVFLDDGVDATAVRYYNKEADIELYGNYLVVPASCPLDKLAECAAQNGKSGMEFANGIPGTVGGAIAGNAGAFGRQIADVINSVRIFTQQCTVREIPVDKMKFEYRSSRIQKSKEVVLSCFLSLQEGNAEDLLKERKRILALRKEKHPDWRVTPCAGSVFKNLEQPDKSNKKTAAGYLLDQVGAKKMRVGGARVFEKHANIIIKDKDDCTSKDVMDLTEMMMKAVKEKFDIALVPEIQFHNRYGLQYIFE